MLNSTLGGLIKDYRLQKGISQLDIAFSLGWKETSRLSRIEQGRTEKPTRELIDKIIRSLNLEEEEKNSLLLTGGYLPTNEEIEKIREETKQILEDWPYPGTVLDFSWRAISQNRHNAQIYQVNSEQEKMIHDSCPRVLDILCNMHPPSESKKGGKLEAGWRQFLKSAILNFKYEQRNRTKDKWYIDHVRALMQNDLFRELWVEVDMRDALKGIVGKSTTKTLLNPLDKSKVLNFYLFVVPVLKDPRFELELLVPRDQETYRFYSQK